VRRAPGIAAAAPGAAATTAACRTSMATAARAVIAGTACVAGIAGIAGIAGCASGAPARHPAPRISYYVSLGDSLSRGMQPDGAGAMVATSQGYADQLYATLRARDPGLRLVKLGCSGETTITMIHGGICHYPGGSQLAAAASFLRGHRDRLSLITIDIGANDFDADLNACLSHASFTALFSCLKDFAPGAVANLTKIMATLRSAAGNRVRIIGMNYYVPTLAQWRNGLLGQAVARVSEEIVLGYNRLLADVYQRYGARVADVFGAFRSGDFSGSTRLPGIGAVPPNVAAICRWTWECAPAPRGPNIHADTAGYGVIAQAFLAADR
jgi:GDSL-like Lipase/Acylhydrolase family